MRITKNTGKPHVILYKRDDGSETWMQSDDYFVVHDLSHFAIEKTLGYTTAFLGMLNSGMDVKDFEVREKRKKIHITEEAAFAENIANLFLMEITQGNFEDFNQTSKESFRQMAEIKSAPLLKENEVFLIRDYLRKLISEWKALSYGETLQLTYEFKKK